MGAVVGAGVSVISGIAGISSKNAQANAQQQQINAQAYQQGVNQAATDAQLQAQQVQARQEYQLGILSRMQSYDQAQAGLVAQQNLAQLKSQADDYAAQYAASQSIGGSLQQAQQLERQAANIQMGTDAKLGGAATKETGFNQQLESKLQQELMGQTAEQRKAISQQAAGRMESSSGNVKQEQGLRESLAEAFARGLDVDSSQMLAEMQSMSEETMATIAEQIGLADTSSSLQTVGDNIRLAAQGLQGGMLQNAADFQNTVGATDAARQTIDYAADAQNFSAQNAYRAQDFSLGMQRDTVAKGGIGQQQQFSAQSSSNRGAGFADYLNLGLQTYGAVSPLLAKRATPQMPVGVKPTTNYSGNPTYFNNAA